MSRFVKVRYRDRYTKADGNDLFFNLDKIIAVDEVNRAVFVEAETNTGNIFCLTEETLPKLLEALKGGAAE